MQRSSAFDPIATPEVGPTVAMLCAMGLFLICFAGASASAQGTPVAFEAQAASELRIWVTREEEGVVQPPSSGQPAETTSVSGTVQGVRDGDLWTFDEVDLAADDVAVAGFWPMSDISFEVPFTSVFDPSGVSHSVANLVGIDGATAILSVSEAACPSCTDFAVSFQFTFGIRPPAAVAIVAPVEFDMSEVEGDTVLSGMVAEGFTALYDGGSGVGPVHLWIELDLALREVPASPPDVLELREGSVVELYEVDVVGEEAQPPDPEDEPIEVSALSGSLESRREGSIWTVTRVDLAAENVSIGGIPLSELGLTMPFSGILDPSGTPRWVTSVTGIDDGSLLVFAEMECAECTDFAVSFNYTLMTDPPASIALIGPLELALGDEGGTLTLGGTFEQGFVLGTLIGDIGLWIRGELDIIAVPEPSLPLLQSMALLVVGLLARPRRLRRGAD